MSSTVVSPLLAAAPGRCLAAAEPPKFESWRRRGTSSRIRWDHGGRRRGPPARPPAASSARGSAGASSSPGRASSSTSAAAWQSRRWQAHSSSGFAEGEPAAAAAYEGAAAGSSDASGSEQGGAQQQEALSWEEVETRLETCINLISTSELLVPYDLSAVNLGLIIWGAIRDIPAAHRHLLVDRLDSSCIRKLWKVTGQRFTAPRAQAAAAMGPNASLWTDMPARLREVSLFRGKAALPTHALGISRFTKALFLKPSGEGGMFGRVLLGKGPLAAWLYPLYFRMEAGPAVVPLSQDLCDFTLEYLDPAELGLAPDDIPRSHWPRPRVQLAPFGERWTDYVRMAGPGVYVGAGMGLQRDSQPLHFVMTHSRIESLLP